MLQLIVFLFYFLLWLLGNPGQTAALHWQLLRTFPNLLHSLLSSSLTALFYITSYLAPTLASPSAVRIEHVPCLVPLGLDKQQLHLPRDPIYNESTYSNCRVKQS